MPTTRKLMGGYFDEKEAAKIKARADKQGLTVANYFRTLAGFKPLQAGARKGNQYAIGNKGRWSG
jgi:hypothetical protein